MLRTHPSKVPMQATRVTAADDIWKRMCVVIVRKPIATSKRHDGSTPLCQGEVRQIPLLDY